MGIAGYTSAKSIVAGGVLGFHVDNAPSRADDEVRFTIQKIGASGPPVLAGSFAAGAQSTPPNAYEIGCGWPRAYELCVPEHWSSGLYLATLRNADAEEENIRFVVRTSAPGKNSRILVCIPFFTTQAYNDWGGKSLYPWDSPDRARRVSFDRPGGTNPRSSLPFVRWLAKKGISVDFCESGDLHEGPALLDPYRLFISVGHDEYWSKEMRDRVEAFARAGGNVAFFSGNTCYWQVRVEDGGRSLVCYRDAVEDPLSGVDNERVTVQWASAPVDRPENRMTGVGYRNGAGYWLDEEGWKEAAYRVNFPEHWVFRGTGLSLGDPFGKGSLGYETDAAEIEWEGGVARATGRGGTPASFVVLAVANLRRWRAHGQGGLATMGIHRCGGTVFTAASVDWSNGLETAPEVERITANVMNKLSERYPERGWERVGRADRVVTMVVIENRMFAATEDGSLLHRDPTLQNLGWTCIGTAESIIAMASPIQAVPDRAVGLWLVTSEGALYFREPVLEEVVLQRIGSAHDLVALAAVNFNVFAASRDGRLFSRPTGGGDVPFQVIGRADGIVSMTGLNGKIFAVTEDGRLLWRAPIVGPSDWIAAGEAKEVRAIAGVNGLLFGATYEGALLRRDGYV